MTEPQIYIGGAGGTIQGRRINITGARCYSPVKHCHDHLTAEEARRTNVLLDSGAFSDPPDQRLTLDEALARQLTWEERTRNKWQPGDQWTVEAIVSYDVLIDEIWTDGKRHKKRWSEDEAWWAVAETIAAARYLDSMRSTVTPRRLVLACQGVTPDQYHYCASEVLSFARPGDWLGLGGWCIIGRERRWIPYLWESARRILPLAREAGIERVHLFGVRFLPVLARLLHLCDQHGLTFSTDSAAPVLDCTWPDPKRAGVRAPSGRWEDNVKWWRNAVAGLREHTDYDWQRHLFDCRTRHANGRSASPWSVSLPFTSLNPPRHHEPAQRLSPIEQNVDMPAPLPPPSRLR